VRISIKLKTITSKSGAKKNDWLKDFEKT